jgi:hypothetical protein
MLGLAPSAMAAPDGNATAAYLHADLTLVRTVAGNIPRSRRALAAGLAHIRAVCPRAAAGSPQNPDSTQLSNELIGTMVLAADRPDIAAIHEFVRRAASLRWANRSLNREAHSYIDQLRTLAALRAPNLCANVSAWRLDGFTTLPATTVHFAPQFMANWVSPGELPPQLAAIENTTARALALHAALLEDKIAEFEAAAVETYTASMNALDLWP